MTTTPWTLELFGRLHPLLVHFPIGLLVGAFLLEGWARLRRRKSDYAGMVYLGAATAVVAAFMGLALKENGDYGGELVDRHQWMGFLTAAFSLITAFLYWRRDRLPNWAPFLGLSLTCLGLTVAGHLGASLTHGEDYLSSVFSHDKASPLEAGVLQELQAYAREDSFPVDQLDRLNLEVRGIFAHNCYQCHSTSKRKGDLALDNREDVFAGGESGPAFVPGRSAESELVRRLLLPRSHDDAMPPKGKSLRAEEIELIRLWIDEGAHWADEALKIFPEAELALVQPPLPQTPPEIKHPVDRFVHVYLEQTGQEWPERVNDRQFIRRAYLDVTGLLPTPEEVTAFVENGDPDKRTRLVDKLLADKDNYAMHWLSFWNDLLRNDYSGTGFITGGRKQVTKWLYESLLEEKPYNQMVRELIDPGPESEGFIKGIQWRGVVNASQRTELQAAQNISQSLLGLNLKCASCHNSFISNLTLDEAYAFASIFAEEPMEIYRCDKPTGRIAEPGFLYEELGQVVSDSLRGRLKELAGIMVKPENGRLYRTLVNRLWDRLLGRGIVAPVDEMDNQPWSQELLDWLAADFIDHDYNIQHVLRRIMTSRAYQLRAAPYPSPEYLASEQFVFRGPAVRRLTAEQFVDAFSQVVEPMYQGLAFDPSGREMEAEWIWHQEIELDRRVLPKPGGRLFRKTFSLDPGNLPRRAEVLITADHAFELFLNGKPVAQGQDWREAQRLEIPVDLLADQNVIAAAGRNDGVIPNPAGLLFTLRLEYADGNRQFIHSDRSWKTTADTLAQNWMAFDYDDTGWQPAWRAGTFAKSHWGSLLSYTFAADSIQLPFARASLVRQDDFMKALGRPVRENVTTQRNAEATLLQSLMLTNSAFFHDHIARGAAAWLERWGDDPGQLLDQLYLEALGRTPTRRERKLLLRQLDTDDRSGALQDIIWALVLLPEFQLI